MAIERGDGGGDGEGTEREVVIAAAAAKSLPSCPTLCLPIDGSPLGRNIHETLYEMRDDRQAYARRKFRYRINEAYVKVLAVKMLHLPVWGYVYALRPILVGLMPGWLYNVLHKRRLAQEKTC